MNHLINRHPIARRIFFGVSILLALAFVMLTIQLLLGNPRESCNAESVAELMQEIPYFTGTGLLLWAGSLKWPRLRQGLALAAMVVLTLMLPSLHSSICCHESYGEVPFYWGIALLCGYLSYVCLFSGKWFYAVLPGAPLVVFLYLATI